MAKKPLKTQSSDYRAVLGLDLGTHTGWARRDHYDGGGSLTSGAWDFTPTRFDAPHIRYLKFKAELAEHLALGVDLVFFEKVHRHRGTAAAHVYGAFLNALQETFGEAGVPFMGLSVQEIKKFATGKGNGSKEEVVRACQCWGFDPKSEDEADAIAILKCGLETKI